MTGIMRPPAPTPDPEIAVAQDRQEARLAEEERSKMAQISARRRARMTGGRRMLLSPMRDDPEKGIQDTLSV